MRHIPNHHKQQGYTLIELLLYVSLVGIMLVAITTFFGTITDSRVKSMSINEVESQGMALMDSITQSVRNATSITTPATGVTATSLTLAVPTASLSPTIFDTSSTILGYNSDGGTTDSSDSNSMNTTKFTASASGTIATLYAHIGPTVSASPNNLGQMALYSGTSAPTTLLASSASVALNPSNWNAFSITPTQVTSGTTYWIAFNANGTASTANDLRYHAGTAGQSQFLAGTFGTWPASFTGTAQAFEFSMYAPIETSTPSALRIKEGAGSVVPLSSTDVQITGLSFKNLTRAGTNGLVQITFTAARFNPGNQNAYDYRRTFTSTAEVGW